MRKQYFFGKKIISFHDFMNVEMKQNTSLFLLSVFKPSFNTEISKANFNPSVLASPGSSRDITLNLT